MRFLLLAALLATPAAAQTPPAELGQRYIPAPWWMKEPVIASTGQVRTEVPANRAAFEARFSEVQKTAEAALSGVTARVRELDRSLSALGDGARVETQFETAPLYDQYRDKDGNLVDNERDDRIKSYSATATVSVELRDLKQLERAYRLAVAARPTSIGTVSFRLEPTNALKTWLAKAAVEDAAQRARESALAAGTRLGPAKVIDPSGSVCATQVLAGWPSYAARPAARDVAAPAAALAEDIVVTGARRVAPALSLEQQAEAVQVTLQPPLRELSASACVIYALLP